MDPDAEAEHRLSLTCDGKGCNQTRALFVVSLPSGGLLNACGHHRREWADQLDQLGAFVLELYREGHGDVV